MQIVSRSQAYKSQLFLKRWVMCFATISSSLLLSLASAQEPNDPQANFINAALREVAELELRYGVYDYHLIEPLGDLARVQHRAGDYAGAVDSYSQALHLSRINNGLYSISQVATLELLIQSEIALKDWDSVNNHYAYMQHLYERLYDFDDPELELGLQKVASWHVRAFNVNLDGDRLKHLRRANQIFHIRLQIAELTLSPNDPMIDFLYSNIEIAERRLQTRSYVMSSP